MRWIYAFYGFAAALVLWTIWQSMLYLKLAETFATDKPVTCKDVANYVYNVMVPAHMQKISSYELFGGGYEVQTPHGTDDELGGMMANISEVGNQLNEDSRYDRVDERVLAERRAEKSRRS
jgi:hypothetical protein